MDNLIPKTSTSTLNRQTMLVDTSKISVEKIEQFLSDEKSTEINIPIINVNSEKELNENNLHEISLVNTISDSTLKVNNLKISIIEKPINSTNLKTDLKEQKKGPKILNDKNNCKNEKNRKKVTAPKKVICEKILPKICPKSTLQNLNAQAISKILLPVNVSPESSIYKIVPIEKIMINENFKRTIKSEEILTKKFKSDKLIKKDAFTQTNERNERMIHTKIYKNSSEELYKKWFFYDKQVKLFEYLKIYCELKKQKYTWRLEYPNVSINEQTSDLLQIQNIFNNISIPTNKKTLNSFNLEKFSNQFKEPVTFVQIPETFQESSQETFQQMQEIQVQEPLQVDNFQQVQEPLQVGTFQQIQEPLQVFFNQNQENLLRPYKKSNKCLQSESLSKEPLKVKNCEETDLKTIEMSIEELLKSLESEIEDKNTNESVSTNSKGITFNNSNSFKELNLDNLVNF